jgi:hypothetical protein
MGDNGHVLICVYYLVMQSVTDLIDYSGAQKRGVELFPKNIVTAFKSVQQMLVVSLHQIIHFV